MFLTSLEGSVIDPSIIEKTDGWDNDIGTYQAHTLNLIILQFSINHTVIEYDSDSDSFSIIRHHGNTESGMTYQETLAFIENIIDTVLNQITLNHIGVSAPDVEYHIDTGVFEFDDLEFDHLSELISYLETNYTTAKSLIL